MTLKVFIKRHVRQGKIDEALAMLNDFRSMAIRQPGYISGETLVNHYDNRSIAVVSTWHSLEDWIQWQESKERETNEAQLEDLLEEPTKYEIYDVGRHHEDTEQDI